MEAYEHILQELEKLEPVAGIIPTDVLDLPDTIGAVIRLLIRKGSMTLPDMAAAMNLEPDQARQISDILTNKGFLIKEYRSGKELIYRACIARMRGRHIPLDL